MELAWVFVVMFAAMFTQSLSGFGFSLVSMPLLVAVIGIRLASPLVALMGLLGELFLLAYFRHHLELRVVGRLAAAAALGIPVGVWLLGRINEDIGLISLGVVVSGYALYALFSLRLPQINRPIWAYIMGFLGGVLGGAYNTSGPPIIIYGDCRQWTPGQFKSNLQGFFVLTTMIIVATHILARNYTPAVWQLMPAALPGAALGIGAGLRLDRRISAATFRKIVLWLLLLIGGRLIAGVFVSS